MCVVNTEERIGWCLDIAHFRKWGPGITVNVPLATSVQHVATMLGRIESATIKSKSRPLLPHHQPSYCLQLSTHVTAFSLALGIPFNIVSA